MKLWGPFFLILLASVFAATTQVRAGDALDARLLDFSRAFAQQGVNLDALPACEAHDRISSFFLKEAPPAGCPLVRAYYDRVVKADLDLRNDCRDLDRDYTGLFHDTAPLCNGRKMWSPKLSAETKKLMERKRRVNEAFLEASSLESDRELENADCAFASAVLAQATEKQMALAAQHYNITDNALSTVCDEIGETAQPEGVRSYIEFVTRGFKN